jgi:phosphoadenosine phosphosulfate reductase
MLLEETRRSLEHLNASEGLKWIADNFQKAKFASSFGEEDQVITHLIAHQQLPITIFTLDTGRLFQETYDLIDLTRRNYNINIDVLFPDQTEVEKYVKTNGINGFYDSVENRKKCCGIRKVHSLNRALAGADIWITGLRKSQSANRQLMRKVEWSPEYNLIKYNPIFDWSEEEMRQYIDLHKVPVNTLHRKGFASIGCAPCTRAIAPGEDLRAGRWWWEGTAKECGLHETKASATAS